MCDGDDLNTGVVHLIAGEYGIENGSLRFNLNILRLKVIINKGTIFLCFDLNYRYIGVLQNG